MGLSDIDKAVKAYRSLTAEERALFKTETKTRQRRKRKKAKIPRAKQAKMPTLKKLVKPSMATSIQARKSRKKREARGEHPDPLRDIKQEPLEAE